MFTQLGQQLLLNWAVRQAGTDLVLRLFENDLTPTVGTIASDVQEAAFAGYAPIPLNRRDWSAARENSLGYSQIDFNRTQVFTAAHNAQGEVYGNYLTDANGLVVAIHKMDNPIAVSGGDTIEVLPQLIFETRP